MLTVDPICTATMHTYSNLSHQVSTGSVYIFKNQQAITRLDAMQESWFVHSSDQGLQ